MKTEELKGKKITVMGLGIHGGGIGAVRFLHEAGAKLIVTDIKTKEELAPSLEKLKDLKNIEYVLGQHRTEDFTDADMVIKTPPAPWNNKHIKLALEKNIPVETDSSLFFKLCKNSIIGITGTKGKTTAATLIYEILKTAGKNPVKAGIGQSSVLDKLKEIKKDGIVVFELSSWRLSGLGKYKLSPHIAVITNIYPDHLNYYGTMEKYIADKKYIFQNQKPEDFCVLNGDDKTFSGFEGEIKSQMIKFSYQKISGERSVYIADEKIYLDFDGEAKEVLDLEDIKLRGQHNWGNIMAAIGATYVFGADLKTIKKAIVDFKGIPHRLEFVREVDGVKYYNDTAATTPESAIAGIGSFSEPLILIAGGSDKNFDMTELGKTIREKIKGVIFLKGEATNKIIATMKKLVPPGEPEPEFTVIDSMEKAVALAKLSAQSGDAVLLSPGATSFGLFAHEFDRGDKFKKAVSELR